MTAATGAAILFAGGDVSRRRCGMGAKYLPTIRDLKAFQQSDPYHKLYQRIWSLLAREMDATHA